MHEPYILYIDTATETCSISLSKGSNIIDSLEIREPNQHAAQLTKLISKIVHSSGIALSDLHAVAVSKGPGSYTGLRIGVSTAKGLCYGLDIPLIAVNTLESMFEGYKSSTPLDEDALYCPMIDARRMEVYTATWGGTAELLEPTSAKVIDEHSFDSYDARPVYLFGSGAPKLKTIFSEDTSIIIVDNFQHASKHMCATAVKRFSERRFEDPVYFEPFYLKDFLPTTPRKK